MKKIEHLLIGIAIPCFLVILLQMKLQSAKLAFWNGFCNLTFLYLWVFYCRIKKNPRSFMLDIFFLGIYFFGIFSICAIALMGGYNPYNYQSIYLALPANVCLVVAFGYLLFVWVSQQIATKKKQQEQQPNTPKMVPSQIITTYISVLWALSLLVFYAVTNLYSGLFLLFMSCLALILIIKNKIRKKKSSV